MVESPAAVREAAVGTTGECSPQGMAPVISVVAPAWNEAASLPEFVRQTTAVLGGLGEPWEIIVVDDGSTDETRRVLHELHAAEPRVKGLCFSRNFGHQVAITAGLDGARGDAVVVIDADLQDPPEVIADLVARWREGYQVVYAVRAARAGESWFKKLTAVAFYRLIRGVANLDIPVDTGDFRLLDRRAADALRGLREQHRYVRGLAAWIGFRSVGVPYQRAARHAGETKYPLRKMFRLAMDGITNFSYLPLQLATYAGFFVAGLSLLGILVAVVLRLFLGQQLTGQATTLVSVLFLGGIQLIFLGIIGEYLGRIYDEVRGRPLYVVDEMLGLTPQFLPLGGHESAPHPHPTPSPEPSGGAGHQGGLDAVERHRGKSHQPAGDGERHADSLRAPSPDESGPAPTPPVARSPVSEESGQGTRDA